MRLVLELKPEQRKFGAVVTISKMSAYFSKTKEQNLNFKLQGKWVHNVYLKLNDMVTLVGELLNFTCAAIKQT